MFFLPHLNYSFHIYQLKGSASTCLKGLINEFCLKLFAHVIDGSTYEYLLAHQHETFHDICDSASSVKYWLSYKGWRVQQESV